MSTSWARSYFTKERLAEIGLKFVLPNKVEKIRIDHLITSHIRPYVKTLSNVCEEIEPIPELIINYDETWMNPHKNGKTLEVLQLCDEIMEAIVPSDNKEKEHITIGTAVTASGRLLKLQAILPIQKIPHKWLDKSEAMWEYLFSYAPDGWAIKVKLSEIFHTKFANREIF